LLEQSKPAWQTERAFFNDQEKGDSSNSRSCQPKSLLTVGDEQHMPGAYLLVVNQRQGSSIGDEGKQPLPILL
jgi:hypothetical protein